MPLILALSWHSFRGFGPPEGAEHHIAANATSCTHRSLLTSCSRGVRGPGGPSRKCRCCVRKSHTRVRDKMVAYVVRLREHAYANACECVLMEHDGAWWSMLMLVTDLYLNVSQDWEWVLNVINHLVPSWSGCKDDSTEISRNPFGKLAEATLALTSNRTWIASSPHCWISTKRFCSVL